MKKIIQFDPYVTHLDILFKDFMEKFQQSELLKISDLGKGALPTNGGIYVFYENVDKAIYVGRTKNIRQRIQMHTRNSSDHYSASFTFNLAKMQYRLFVPEEKKLTRNDLMNDLAFIPIFNEQKFRVKNMHIKFFVEEHDILQTMLEPYFAFKLKTYPEFNTFETH